ncbi:Cell number regulator 5 [Apostasia shenzhenica]|uniref:Cell number regulator 5 n=1 Tax=Apostasia shenzhenica TaxID=1088818 RepID=A0A2I0AQZ2_9ASPA|nr:Cell number regulator 5 [Apostasia shenzhenica]
MQTSGRAGSIPLSRHYSISHQILVFTGLKRIVNCDMAAQGSYVPPPYIPLHQSDSEGDDVSETEGPSLPRPIVRDTSQWSSGICACCDDMQSCIIGTICPCFLFGKNAEFLGSGTLAGSCMTHFILWGLVNSLCCLFSGGILAFVPGGMVACYACGYRKALRAKFDLQEAPCGDLTTHLFCHLCANCQEYREIRERSTGSTPSLPFSEVTAPSIQTMDPPENEA